MAKRLGRRLRRRGLACLVVVTALGFASVAFGDGVAMFLVSKSLPESTVSVIDPESGTSSGGGSTDVRLAPGDIISFRFNFFPVPDKQIHGINGWLTEYVPENTEVVGVRLIDADGNTVTPRYPGLASDDCGATCNGFNSVPSSSGTRNLDDGSIAQVYADTGVFYTTSTRLGSDPAGTFITFDNGILMSPEPRYVGNINGLLGASSPYYAHNAWDWAQVRAYGTSTSASGNSGSGNTPYLYGSPVAGPETFYQYEATETAGGAIEFNDVVGPWNRIVYPGSTIGFGTPATGTGTAPTRMVQDASSLGFDVTPATPLPSGTRALRLAMGEIRVGEPLYAEVALRVLATPIDPLLGDADCAESFGGDISARSATTRAKDNPWGLYLGSPGCVFLNLLFDLSNDAPLATGGQTVTFTLRTRNLSTLPQNGADVIQKFDSTRMSYVGVVAGTPTPALVADCELDGFDCLVWPTRDYAPSEETVYETQFTVGGSGQNTHVMKARFTSTRLTSPGFTTQTINMIRDVGVPDTTLAYTGTSTAPGGTGSLSGDVGVLGTNNVGYEEYIPVLPAGWTVSGGSILFNGTTITCSANCGTNRPEFNLATNIPAGARRSISFSVNVPAGTPAGLYDIDVSLWGSQTAFGGRSETYFRDLATVAVGQPRAAAPIIDCPCTTPPDPADAECGHPSSVPTITGSGAPAGATVRVYLNGILRGSGTADGAGNWSVDVSSFGQLYPGVEIRATADGTSSLESVVSDRCDVRDVRACSDGLDNDGDGLVDFPADPGCSSLADRDETDVACSDGVDNDGDGDIDWPDDFECSGPDGTTEGGPPQCGDGVDNDGDGTIDTADPCCVDAFDRTEGCYRQCNDLLDNDGDAFVDFAEDAGCHAVNDDDETNLASSGGVNARLLFAFDTSGSMNWNTCDADFTGGDGSVECGGDDVSCATCSSAGCGDGLANDSRIDKAKRGISNVVAAYGEVEWGLMRFHQRAAEFACPTTNASEQSGGWQGAGAAPCGGGFNSGDLLVGFGNENQYDLLEWMDGRSNYPGGQPPPGMDIELRGSGTTPISGILESARTYLQDERAADGVSTCRPYRVILITDGQETCGGDPVASAATLEGAGFLVHVIGFAVDDPAAVSDLNAIASAGGTTNAIFVDDETTLSAAIADIVGDTVLVETCNGADDDCDTLIDEGFTLYCDRPAGTTSATLCTDPGESVCDGVDDNCNGLVDEGLLNDCGLCGATPTEVCDRLDNDCDGAIDEDDVCGTCFPSAEICDGLDNDCDDAIDESLTRVCGTDVGECVSGSQTCTAGSWGTCTATGPTAEVCDNLDNDCDGNIDGISEACGTDVGACAPGTRTCTAGSFGSCMGAIGPSSEICNLIDDDCDGTVDDGNPGGGGACGSDIGECSPGTYQCMGGSLVCTGGVSPSPEACNSLDDDCDGLVDEAVPTGGSCGSDVGECRPGVLTCSSGTFVCTGARGPTTELCDGLDNNCDGSTDEGNPGGGGVCGSDVGECAPGTTQCVSGSLTCVGDTGPGSELCNVLDDDCDGIIDEGNPEGGASCGTTDVGECEFGALTCVSGSLTCTGESGPSADICDGLDNDCDTLIDEADPDVGGACGDDTGACMPGTWACTAGSLTCDGAVGPTMEVCNAIDDDCDGVVDDGIPVGAPCGSDVGECSPGLNICRDGMIVCEGGTGPIEEICDALDNDCDATVDEGLGLGAACGVDEGLCMAGMIQCIGGTERCVGEVPPVREACDCGDNDCDGAIDEMPSTGTLCPSGSECVECQCATECVVSEFAPPCAEGKVPVTVDGVCWCLVETCNDESCGAETIEVDGEVLCAPDMLDSLIGACVCKENECTHPCSGVVCTDGLVCDARDGRCRAPGCAGLGCASGEVCDFETGECVTDPCVDAGCAVDEACRAGTCVDSCADVTCGAGERCHDGVCEEDPCFGAMCAAGEVCSPADGSCITNMCAGIRCADHEVCDPVTGDCEIDPCRMLVCPEDQMCVAGECVAGDPTLPDAGPLPDGSVRPDSSTMEMDAGPEDLHVLATGGGGCLCSAPGADETGSSGSTWWAGLLGLLVMGRLVRRRRDR